METITNLEGEKLQFQGNNNFVGTDNLLKILAKGENNIFKHWKKKMHKVKN